MRGWRLETAEALEAKDDEFVTIQELERDGFETSFALDKIHGYVRIVALDSAKAVMAYSAVQQPSPSSVPLWTILYLCSASRASFSYIGESAGFRFF